MLTPFQTRPLALGRRGAAATPHPVATAAALDVLRAGGNAVDAAVAAAATCTVVQPWSSSVAGVGWATVYDAATATTEVLDFHGIVPAGLDPSAFAPGPGAMVDWPRLERSASSLLGSLVPGAAAGWETLLQRKGRWTLGQALGPAITAAAEGVAVSEALHAMIVGNAHRLRRWPHSARLYLPGDRPLAVGQHLVQSDLAGTYQRIAANGSAEIRQGRTASDLARFYAEHGGVLSPADLATYTPSWHSPLTTSFRGHTVLATPGPLGDAAFALGLQLLDTFPPFTHPTDPDYIHASIESARLVAAERSRLLGPGAGPEVVDRLLSPTNVAALAGRIGQRAAAAAAAGSPEDTITLVVVDDEGNAAHLMQTVGTFFGSAAVAGATGILANTSLYFASPGDTGANRIVPGQGVEQNPCLATVLDPSGRLRLVVGSPGGKTRVETVRQMLVNVIDFGCNLQQAVDAPRFLAGPDGITVEFEARYGPLEAGLRRQLEQRGHVVDDTRDDLGSGQAIAIDPDSGTLVAAADWRRESLALAY